MGVGPDLTHNGDYELCDAFVAKVSPSGAELVYAGYIGGLSNDIGLGIAVDRAGAAYVTGYASSDAAQERFPVRIGPDLTFNGGGADAFVAKVSPSGAELVYAGYIGGSGNDNGPGDPDGRYGIAVDGAGAAYITGFTSSDEASFPVRGGPDLSYNGGTLDAFVAKVAPSGAELVYAGYIGGTQLERGRDIAVDGAGAAYVTGWTYSDEGSFPVRGGPDLTFNGAHDAGPDAFVARVAPSGSELVYAGYIGGADGGWDRYVGADRGWGIAMDEAGAAYVTGDTYSSEASFPVVGGPDLTHNGGTDAFVAKVNDAGYSSPLYLPLIMR